MKAATIAIIIAVLAIVLYHEEKAKCKHYGQSYKMEIPSLDGVCVAYLDDGSEVYTPIELVDKIKYNPHTGERGWRNEP